MSESILTQKFVEKGKGFYSLTCQFARDGDIYIFHVSIGLLEYALSMHYNWTLSVEENLSKKQNKFRKYDLY